jgi:Holliday junction resolvase
MLVDLGSSTGLPDVVATNKPKSVLYSIECKSGESDILYISRDQIESCQDITDKILTAYENSMSY